MPLWHADYFKLKAIRKSRSGKALKIGHMALVRRGSAGWSVVPYTKTLWVQSLVREHT